MKVGVAVTLPDYVKRKHRIAALIWGAASLAAIFLLFLLRTPVPETVSSYQEIERVHAGFDKAVILSGETTLSVKLDQYTSGAAVYGFSLSAQREKEAALTVGFLGEKRFLIKQEVLAFSRTENENENTVYIIKDASADREKIWDVTEGWQDDISGYEEKIELLSGLEPLMLEEYSESELRPFGKAVLWLFLMIALIFFGTHVLPLLLPWRSKTGACFRAYDLAEADVLQLDADQNTESGVFPQKRTFISPRYVSVSHYTSVFIAPIRSLLWVYPAQVIANARYGADVIWYLECWFIDGRRQRLQMKDKEEAAAFSEKIKESFPGVLAGFSGSIFQLYDGAPEKLRDFSGQVQQRQEGLSPRAQADIRRALWGLDEEYQ